MTLIQRKRKLIQEFGDRVTYDLTGFIESLVKQMEDRKGQITRAASRGKSIK